MLVEPADRGDCPSIRRGLDARRVLRGRFIRDPIQIFPPLLRACSLLVALRVNRSSGFRSKRSTRLSDGRLQLRSRLIATQSTATEDSLRKRRVSGALIFQLLTFQHQDRLARVAELLRMFGGDIVENLAEGCGRTSAASASWREFSP